jgi:predicted nucleotidyltransferase
MDFDLRAHTHLLCTGGSRAYGLHTAGSDVDVKGVAVPPARYYHGFLRRFEQADRPGHMSAFWDQLSPAEQEVARTTKVEGTVYELTKFVKLAADCNPNILDVLFCREEEVRLCSPLGRRLREQRQIFLSRKARHTFGGYATAQLKRIETHRRWLLHPITREPQREDFSLPHRTLIPSDQLAAAWAAIQARVDSWAVDYGALPQSAKVHIQGQVAAYLAELGLHHDDRWQVAARAIGYDENFMLLLDRERRYKAARNEWEQYQSWTRTRNPDRAALEASHGYDVKHGAHLIRLLRMAGEVLLTGQVHIWRGDIDAEELLSIRRGAWSYERLISYARDEERRLEGLTRAGSGPLPEVPDAEAIDQLCVGLVETALAEARTGASC